MTEVRTAREVTLPLRIDRNAEAVLPTQVVVQLRELIAKRVLEPADELPSTRALASHLGISRGTVVTAYDQLIAEGWLAGAAGRSTIVNPRLREVHPYPTSLPSSAVAGPNARRTECGPSEGKQWQIDLRPGRPLQSGVVGPAWRAAWRRAADAPLDVVVPPLGWPPLRAAIADHLRRMRAVVGDPEHIAITAGGREGLALLLAASGARSVGVEDPGYPSLRRVLEGAGVRVHLLPVDNHGLVTDALPEDSPDLVIVTPSHQYPLGGSLPIDRRQQLLAWASRRGVIIVEDDYDSELRYTSAPLPALTALDAAGRVALLGTFAKTMTPALATGFIVVPPSLIEALTATRARLGQPVNLVTQRALADYLESGALRRHIQRMRNLYRRRRTQVVRTLRDVPNIRVSPMDGGLHAVVEHDLPELAVIERLALRGVQVSALSDYWAGGGARRGLVFGFGHVSDADLAEGLTQIASALAQVRADRAPYLPTAQQPATQGADSNPVPLTAAT